MSTKHKIVQQPLDWKPAATPASAEPQESGFIEIIDDEMPREILDLVNKLLYAWWLSEGDELLRRWTIQAIRGAQSQVKSVIMITENEIVEELTYGY